MSRKYLHALGAWDWKSSTMRSPSTVGITTIVVVLAVEDILFYLIKLFLSFFLKERTLMMKQKFCCLNLKRENEKEQSQQEFKILLQQYNNDTKINILFIFRFDIEINSFSCLQIDSYYYHYFHHFPKKTN